MSDSMIGNCGVLVDGRVYSVIPVEHTQIFIDLGWEEVYRSHDDKVVIMSKPQENK